MVGIYISLEVSCKGKQEIQSCVEQKGRCFSMPRLLLDDFLRCPPSSAMAFGMALYSLFYHADEYFVTFCSCTSFTYFQNNVTKMVSSPWKLFFLASAFANMLVASGEEFGCNICGCDNCTFANPMGVVNFIYNNKIEKRPCTLLQQQVENPTIYNRTYCHEVIWKQAYDVCQCYNVNDLDTLLSDIPGEFSHSERFHSSVATPPIALTLLPFVCFLQTTLTGHMAIQVPSTISLHRVPLPRLRHLSN